MGNQSVLNMYLILINFALCIDIFENVAIVSCRWKTNWVLTQIDYSSNSFDYDLNYLSWLKTKNEIDPNN